MVCATTPPLGTGIPALSAKWSLLARSSAARRRTRDDPRVAVGRARSSRPGLPEREQGLRCAGDAAAGAPRKLRHTASLRCRGAHPMRATYSGLASSGARRVGDRDRASTSACPASAERRGDGGQTGTLWPRRHEPGDVEQMLALGPGQPRRPGPAPRRPVRDGWVARPCSRRVT